MLYSLNYREMQAAAVAVAKEGPVTQVRRSLRWRPDQSEGVEGHCLLTSSGCGFMVTETESDQVQFLSV